MGLSFPYKPVGSLYQQYCMDQIRMQKKGRRYRKDYSIYYICTSFLPQTPWVSIIVYRWNKIKQNWTLQCCSRSIWLCQIDARQSNGTERSRWKAIKKCRWKLDGNRGRLTTNIKKRFHEYLKVVVFTKSVLNKCKDVSLQAR